MSGDYSPRARPALSMTSTLILLTVFSVAFACIEAAVVHYLHLHFYPEGFGFPIVQWPMELYLVEMAREFSTVVVLAAVSILAAVGWWQRIAFFMFMFGVWDIFYYLWLVPFEGWPPSLFTPDLLFLLPVPWVGPVIAPVIVSLGLILSAWLIIHLERKREVFAPGFGTIVLIFAGWLIILLSFMWHAPSVLETGATGPFRWDLFLLGTVLWFLALAGEKLRDEKSKERLS